jgi:hypothetical protein
MNKTAIVSTASRLGLDVTMEAPGDGAIRYSIGRREPNTGCFFDCFHGSASEVSSFLRGYEEAWRKYGAKK